MEYSYKFRLYPNRKQETQMLRTFGCCRFVFNHYLADRIETYKETGKSPTRFEQDRNLTVLKKQEETSWLREVDATALQSSLRDLDDAYQNFFRRVKHGEKPGFPRFKSKHDHRQSYKSKCVGTNIKVLDKAIQLPKLGAVKCRISKEVKGRILSATVSRNPSGKYFVSLCCTDAEVAALPTWVSKTSLFHRTALLMKTISTSQRAKRNLPNCKGSSLEKQKGAATEIRHVCRLLDCMSIFQTSARICSISFLHSCSKKTTSSVLKT